MGMGATSGGWEAGLGFFFVVVFLMVFDILPLKHEYIYVIYIYIYFLL